ncbi:YgaP family membrane protein [Thiorhodospira sibirica]|uniref:YgaP family membrane protein n=1 Tax=Thiorhodospira sibirica TaxID=154347 RepID=UPI00022C58DD|nr:DUF2892 domain-containing protein [Thiorhodospira sibirica]
MKNNIGANDKLIRIVVGLVLIGMAVMQIGTPWTWIGVLPLATALIGFCPAYTLLGINTCGSSQKDG